MMTSSPNYLSRYPYTLDTWYAEAPPNVTQVYRNKSRQETAQETVNDKRDKLNCKSLTVKQVAIDNLRRPLMTAQINSAYRMMSPGDFSGARAYNLPYSKSFKSRLCSEGPTRYKIVHQFQSRFIL
eukprot:TRINITY_DN14206_c0_g1_i1.p1 TRINITY_DN14206_c0_g1~~TRINITY_DN14206_c0_g1_i1.p1  ORF type:complete len:126 (-),score=17.35 TRINITY_DN14206_c0_g1_i1:57-434(-)